MPRYECGEFLIFLLYLSNSRKLSVNSLRRSRKIISYEILKNILPSLIPFLSFSENFETMLVNVRFHFCLATEFIGQDRAILPNEQSIKLRESRARQDSNDKVDSVRYGDDCGYTSSSVRSKQQETIIVGLTYDAAIMHHSLPRVQLPEARKRSD